MYAAQPVWPFLVLTSRRDYGRSLPPGLVGVQMPTASVLLHFASSDPRSTVTADKAYPIIDFRARWSLNCEKRRDTFESWWGYVQACRALAAECGVSMRDVDRGLWEYSNQNQQGKTCG